MTSTAVFRIFVLTATGLAGMSAMAADDLPRLAIFNNRTPGKGMWKMQILDSSDKEMLKNASKMGSVGICMDAANEMAEKVSSKGNAAKETKSKCDTKIVRNTASVAEMTVTCPDGQKSHVTMTAESKDSMLIQTHITEKSGKTTMMKVRYAYAGACKSDSMFQMDGSSDVCKKIKAQMASMDPAVACAKATGSAKAACEAQMKSAREQMAKMCP